jgi:hypothetical protein
MKSLANAFAIAACLLLFAPGTGAQEPQSDEQTVPAFKLEFSQGKPIPWIAASSVIRDLPQCSSDGTPFVDEVISPQLMEDAVVSLQPEGGHEFSLKSVPKLYSVSLASFFPAGSTVAFLVSALDDPSISNPAFEDFKSYILLFDRKGSYKSAIDLPAGRFQYRKVAALSSGSFLLLGYDHESGVAGLRLFSPNGQFLRAVTLPGPMYADSKLKEGEARDPVAAGKREVSITRWQFAPVRDDVVLYEPGSTAPIMEILGNGVTREVNIAAPKGYLLNAVLPGTSQWIVRFQRQETSTANPAAVDARPSSENFVLYQVNPQDGSLRLRLKEEDSNSIFEIACETDGTLRAISRTNDNRFALSTADLPR